MKNENRNETACLPTESLQKKFNPKIFLENKMYCLCDDFSQILRRSKKTTNYHQVSFDYWDFKKDSNGDKTTRPFEFSDLCLIYDLTMKQPNGEEKGELVVKNKVRKLSNIFPFKMENGLPFFLLVCFRRGQWGIASYILEEEIDKEIDFRIISKRMKDEK